MEMNTRIQVEHPITEITTGIDLVAWQIRIAAGQRLTITERDCQPRGHAIECRVTAEDAWRDFSPNVGTIETYIAPGGPWVRVDSHLYPGYRIPPFYDSLLGKIIVWGEDRAEAITRMERALAETVITGVAQTASFLETVIGTDEFRTGEYDTEWLARNQDMLQSRRPGNEAELDDTALKAVSNGPTTSSAD
jgi:acetyl-CoA carboxylase biotin carboxylase subunit